MTSVSKEELGIRERRGKKEKERDVFLPFKDIKEINSVDNLEWSKKCIRRELKFIRLMTLILTEFPEV